MQRMLFITRHVVLTSARAKIFLYSVLPYLWTQSPKTRGRPALQEDGFYKIVDYLKHHDDEQILISDLVEKIDEMCEGNAYSQMYLKKRLKQHFRDEIIITDIPGPISENSFHRTSDNASYTTSSTCYTASTRSRSTRASQLRFSISGFCSSYYEVQKFESSAAAVQGVDLPGDVSNIFVQFVEDNVDHNTRIIDGLNTFNGMGIIAGITPGTKRTQPIPRIAFSSDEIKALAKIEIKYYKPQTDLMA
ncbi:unnamed protein product [Mytilus coruscus]|uniref:Uncharacterized protein n=1 Tax=Mytilus coruscus TaxID=42192 RepID=A0A6J8CQI3_MYTCO|nr:unnamed protein product [Mytilus coruscus]